jgi:hypothetical protein
MREKKAATARSRRLSPVGVEAAGAEATRRTGAAEGQHRGDQERDGGGDSGEEHGAGPGHKCHLVLLGGDGQMDRDDGVVGQRLATKANGPMSFSFIHSRDHAKIVARGQMRGLLVVAHVHLLDALIEEI